MKNWRTTKALYHFVERSHRGAEEYDFVMTGDEVRAWCKTKNELHGYISGVGGDRSYSCIAWLVTY